MRKKSQGPSLFDNAKAEVKNASIPDNNATASDENAGGKIRLSDFVENPDNPQTITDRAFDRLTEKIDRIPIGLTAKRIAYVTDHAAGKFVVISGNKRLRVLKRLYGDDAEVPADWFQDVTSMTQDQRDEYIVTMNVVEGKWIAKLLVAMFPKEKLAQLMDDVDVTAILADLPAVQQVAPNKEVDQNSFADLMEFKVKLTSDDRDKAVALLDSINPDDMSAAFMSLICGGER